MTRAKPKKTPKKNDSQWEHVCPKRPESAVVSISKNIPYCPFCGKRKP